MVAADDTIAGTKRLLTKREASIKGDVKEKLPQA